MTVITEDRVAAPFKGLVPFEDSALDALLFFGRERERDVIAANLLASRLTVLYGATGVGKSSVLRAGVAHHLRTMARRNLETRGHPEFVVVVFDSWTEEPMAALVESVQAELTSVFGRELTPSGRGATPTDTLHDWSNALDCDLLLVLDQTEEYFLYHEHEEGQGTVAGELPDLVTRPGLRVSVLLAIRDDALAQLDRFKGKIPNLFANYLRLDHLDRRAARAAVVAPIEQYNKLVDGDDRVAIEPELVEALLDETTTGRVDLGRRGRGVVRHPGSRTRIETAYLQLVLQRLWEEEHDFGSRVLRLETLDRLGGANEVVRTHLERALAELPAADKAVAADVFSHLVTPSGTKIAHGLHDLAEYAHVGEERLEPIVSRLVQQRILRPVAKRTNGSSDRRPLDTPVEIFHDVLGEAVLAWRATYESDRRVADERSEADRRHRRVIRILAIAFAAFVAMSAVAAYAVVQRGEARKQAARATEQAAVARQQRAEAVKQKQRAVAATGRARRARRNAVTQRDIARVAEAQAREQRAVAEAQRGIAVRERTTAVSARNRAAASATAATAARRDAERQERIAVRERGSAVRQRRLAQARLLTEQARAALTVDPVRTLTLTLRAAQLRATAETESVLRDGLLALRVFAVLRGGGGGLAGAKFARGGSMIVTAARGARGEVRVFGGRPLRVLQRMAHGAPVRAFAIGDDGRLVATSGEDGVVRVWEAETGRAALSLPHGVLVRGLEFSPDGRLLATGGDDGLARLYDVGSGLLLRRWEHPRALRSVHFSPEGRLVVTVPLVVDRFARVFDVTADTPVAALEHGGVVTSAHFGGPGGGTVVTTGRRNVFVWERGSWRQRHLLTGHVSAVHGVAVSPDGRFAVSYDDAGAGRLWRLDTGTLVSTYVRHENSIESGEYAQDGSAILTSSTDLTARIWTGAQAEFHTALVGHRDTVVTASFHPSGQAILTGSADGAARLWHASTEPTLIELGARRHPRGATSIDVNGRLVATGGVDGEVAVWRARGGLVRMLRHGARVDAISFFDGGRLLVTGGEDGVARVWRVNDGRQLRELRHGAPVRAVAGSRNGRLVVTVGGQAARAWSAAGAARAVLQHRSAITSVALSDDGATAVVGSADGTARIWSTDGRGQPRVLAGHTGAIVAVAVGRGGRHVATASADATAAVWQSSSGSRVLLEGHPEALTSISFSRDGRRVLTASVDGQVRSWSVTGAGEPVVFRGHVSRVADARFSPDGRWVVTAGPSAAGLWFARSGKRIYFLRGHEDPLVGALFTGGSRRIVTASGDGTVRRYVCDVCGSLAELRALARSRLRAIERVGD